MRSAFRLLAATTLVTIVAVLTTTARAQQDIAEEDQQSIDEIVVIGNKSGDPIDLDARYEQQLRARIVADYLRQRDLDEEEQWRKSLPTAVDGGGRIKWGYDAQSESRMRREAALTDLPTDTVKPATLISISF